MKIVEPDVMLITEPDILKRIELAGRVCYKSEDRIAEGTDLKFFNALRKRGHTSVFEHSNIVVEALEQDAYDNLCMILHDYEKKKYLDHHIRHDFWGTMVADAVANNTSSYFSGNLRAWRNVAEAYRGEPLIHNLFADHPLFADIWEAFPYRPFVPEDFDLTATKFAKRYESARIVPFAPGKQHNILTLRFICSRAIANDIVRHRTLSFSQESTRYVDVSNLEVTEPWWMRGEEASLTEHQSEALRTEFLNAMGDDEFYYSTMILTGARPQLARTVLPQETKCELIATGTILDWERFLDLRLGAGAHPDIRYLAKKVKDIVDLEAEKTDNWMNPRPDNPY